jgi:FkbM family methyltransferase
VLGAAHSFLRRLGYDVIRYPAGTTLGSHLEDLFRLLAIDCVIDVGANRGQYGTFLRSLGYAGRIVSVEPVAEVTRDFPNAGDPAWTVENVALGAQRDRRTIDVARDPLMTSLLPPSAFTLERQPGRVEPVATAEVDVLTLADFCDAHVRPGERVFVKLDTQGYEGEILRGGGHALGSIAGFHVELAVQRLYDGQPDYLTLLAAFRDHGFCPTMIIPYTAEADLKLIELDCVLRRAS